MTAMTTAIAPSPSTLVRVLDGQHTPSGHRGRSVPEAVPETLSAAGTTSSAATGAASLTS